MPDPSEEQKRLRGKNLALGLLVGGMCLLFFIITIVRMGAK